MRWGSAGVSPGHVPRGGLPLLGHRAGRGGGQLVTGLLRAGGLCHFCVRSWAARVVLPLLRCVLRALVVWPCCSWGGEPRGVRAQLVGWPVPVSGTRVIAPRSREGVSGGLSPPPLVQAFGRPRVHLAVCLWLAAPPAVGRPPTHGGRWRMS